MAVNFKRWCRNVAKPKLLSMVVTVIFLNVLVVYLLQFKSTHKWREADKFRFQVKQWIVDNNVEQQSQSTLKSEENVESGSGDCLHVGTNSSSCRKRQTKMITAEEFRHGQLTGNPLIDDYGKDENARLLTGQMGRGVVLTVGEKQEQEIALTRFKVNTLISDAIPLNRLVPDSRLQGCGKLQYPQNLPMVSVIIPFYNEWPSLLLRTVYSVINRSPRELLKDIILIDDASSLDSLQDLEDYIANNFPKGLVRLVRMPSRLGLINARMRGSNESTGDVLVFFDSHMEVNIDWLPPLLSEIAKDRKTVAMATLDYIQADSFEYRYNVDYLTRYGWDWRLVFFETFFRNDQIFPSTTSPRMGATMVGAAFAIDKKYFYELGGYDEGMTVWGGENLEMTWRVWLCGGQLLHVPCSRIGHVPRSQPYSFPGGRAEVEHFNYKRAVSVWMGNYSRFVYHSFPDMKTLDAGDLSKRFALKEKLKCKDFSWYLRNVWPELNVPDENVTVWGEVANSMGLCLDNLNYLFQAANGLALQQCANSLNNQAFSLTKDGLLRTTLQCVVVHDTHEGGEVQLEDCIIGTHDKWSYTQDKTLFHQASGLCMDVGPKGPILSICQPGKITQKWEFRPYTFDPA